MEFSGNCLDDDVVDDAGEFATLELNFWDFACLVAILSTKISKTNLSAKIHQKTDKLNVKAEKHRQLKPTFSDI